MNILYLLQVLVGFGFVIFIHELGHFLAAKRVGIHCPGFSIGFPFPLWTPKGWKALNIFKFKWRGTEYRLGWIPFGGYVQMKGQSDAPTGQEGPKKDDPTDYRNKSYFQKTQVLLGGVTMNAITAVIGFIIAFQLGVTFIEPTVGMVDSAGQAWLDNEIQVGDRILEVNGREVVDFEDVVYAGLFDGGKSIDVLVERGEGENVTRHKVKVPLDLEPNFKIMMPSIKARHRVVLTEEEALRFPESLGEDRPRDGDELAAVNGRPVLNAQDAQGLLEVSRGPIELTLRRGVGEDAREWKVTHTPRRKYFGESSPFRAGVSVMPPPWVDRVRKRGAGDQAGLKQGDRLVGMISDSGAEVRFSSFGDLTTAVDATGGKPMTLLVERNGATVRLPVTPEPRESRPGRFALGITVGMANPAGLSEEEYEAAQEKAASRTIAWGVRPGSAIEKAGLKPGEEIVGMKVDGKSVTNPETGAFDFGAMRLAFAIASDNEEGADLTLEIQRPDGVQAITVKTEPEGPDSIAYLALAAAEKRSAPVRYGLIQSVGEGFYHSKKVGYKILMTFAGLFAGRVKIWHLGGPVLIAKRSYSLAQWGAGTLIFFLAFISVNLAIVNLIPLPVLDGGQWMIVTIEAIRGRPLPERAMSIVSMTSFIFVVGLMLFVLGNDIVTVWIRGWA
ncbi:MAG: site-2 protease family protein [Planctomycetes bacterium]|nr:site-2 protease family protein [Planctomycetota bacterium]